MDSLFSTTYSAGDWNDVRFEELEKQFLQLPEEHDNGADRLVEEPDEREKYKMYSTIVFFNDYAQTRAIPTASYPADASACLKRCSALTMSEPRLSTSRASRPTVTLDDDILQVERQTPAPTSTPALSYSSASSPDSAYECFTTDDSRSPTPILNGSDTFQAACKEVDGEHHAVDYNSYETRGPRSRHVPRKRKHTQVEDDDDYVEESSAFRRAPLRKRKSCMDNDDEHSQNRGKRSSKTKNRTRNFPCPHCFQTTFTHSDLVRHIGKHKPKTDFCKHPECNERLFARVDALKRHIRTSHYDVDEADIKSLMGKRKCP